MKILCKSKDRKWECTIRSKEVEGKKHYWILVPCQIGKYGGSLESGRDEKELLTELKNLIKKHLETITIFKWEVVTSEEA